MASAAEAVASRGVTEEEALLRLDNAAIAFQREGRYLDALECMERGLILRHRMYGGRSHEVLAACKAAGELCNLLAMTYLQRGARAPRVWTGARERRRQGARRIAFYSGSARRSSRGWRIIAPWTAARGWRKLRSAISFGASDQLDRVAAIPPSGWGFPTR